MLDIPDYNKLLGNPIFGSSWEGFALENILAKMPGWQASFYRSASGVEIDLILEKGQKRIAVEFKASASPQISKGFWIALEDLEIDEAWIVALVKDTYPIKNRVNVLGLEQFLKNIEQS